jgi:hypothetical protein
MTDDNGKKAPPSKKREDLALAPGGPRSKSRTAKVEPGQHVTVESGHLKIVQTDTGEVVAEMGPVGKRSPGRSRAGKPMKEAEPPKTTK